MVPKGDELLGNAQPAPTTPPNRDDLLARLAESEARLQLAQEVGGVGTYEIRSTTGEAIWSDELYRLYERDPLLGPPSRQEWPTLVHPEDLYRVQGAIPSDAKVGDLLESEFRIRTPGGGIRWLATRAKVFADDEGRPTRFVGVNIDITALKQTEQKLAESEERLRLATDGAHVGLWDWDLVNAKGWWSQRTAEIMGVDSADVTPEQRIALIHPDDRPKVAQALQTAIGDSGDYAVDYRIRRPDGEVRHVRSRGLVTRAKDGTPLRSTGMLIDVTQERLANEALRESQDRLRRAQEAGGIGGYEWAMEGGPGELSDSMLRMIGLEPGQPYTLKEVIATVLPEDRGPVMATVAAIGQGSDRAETDYRVRLPDGTIRWIRDTGQLERDADGKPVRWVGVVQDVTERKSAELRLKESESRLRAVLDSVSDGFYAVDGDWRLTVCNRAAEAYLGIDAQVAVGSDFLTAIGRDAPMARESLASIFAAASHRPLQLPSALRPDRTIELRAGALPDGGWAVAFTDVTERVRAEEALQKLNETLERRVEAAIAERDRTWNNARDLLVVLDNKGVFRAVNPAWTAILGYGPGELVGRGYLDFIHPDDQSSSQGALDTASRETLPTYENRYRHRDGSFRSISWVAAPEGELIYASGRDVTAERERERDLLAAQEALRQAQKMEAMGQLTGGVAHDFNNLLSPIVGALDLLQRKGVGGEREQRLIAGALQSAERAKTLVQRLLAFARRQPLQPKPVDIGALVEGMADLVASTTGPQIKVVVDVADEVPAAIADANQLEMAILNLSVNARDAMETGGTLRISADSQTIGARHRSRLRPGRYVRLSVADTGAGMDETTLARAVEPFFSTKGVGRGTGLGLSMVHGLALQLGGALIIDSRPGLGTNVEIWLPASAADASLAVTEEFATPPAVAAGTALLVDDEEMVRASSADMLGDLGYSVVEAVSAEEALRLVDGGLIPDVLVTDHLMPGMSGTDLARTLRGRWPQLRVLVVSGYAEVDDVAPDLPRLVKPFRQSDLGAMLAAQEFGTGP